MAEDQCPSAMEVDENKIGKLGVDKKKEVVDEAIASCSKKEELCVVSLSMMKHCLFIC